MVQHVLWWGRQKSAIVEEEDKKNKKTGAHDMEMLLESKFNDFFGGREDEDKRRQKNCQFKSVLFGHILEKNPTHPLIGTWSILLVQIRFTPSAVRDPGSFVTWFFKNPNPEKKGIFPWSDIMVHGVNRT